MSFSKPKASNPCKKFVEFKGDSGVWEYYDKEKSEKVRLDTPIFMVILDQLSTIRGYSDEHNSGIYSNEVHSLSNESLSVKSFKGNLSISGKYSEIKDAIARAGGKFCKSVYAMVFDRKMNVELVNFQISGAALNAWIEFKFDANSHIVAIEHELLQGKKGSVKYVIPVFKRYAMKPELVQKAIDMDRLLQDFFESRKAENESVRQEKEIVSSVVAEEKTAPEVFYTTNYEKDRPDRSASKDSPVDFKFEEDEESDLPF